MPRIMFEKTGNAVWISHLDLMRLFQRAFKRAGLPLKHTQGFNPRPSVSIALPLSVGVESHCELLDFDIEGEAPSSEILCEKLNKALVSGVRVLQVYDAGRKLKELSLMSCRITLTYDAGVPADAVPQIKALFCSESLIVEKKSKNGIIEQDILPLIRRITFSAVTEKTLKAEALVCCQNPSLNPVQIVNAIEKYLPAYTPDDAQYCRMEIFDNQENIFR